MKLTVILATMLCVLGSTACDSAVNGRYPGASLLSLHGEMRVASSYRPSSTVQLAIVWRTYFGETRERFKVEAFGFEAQELAYQGTFPQRYAFEIHQLPPSAPGRVPMYAEGTLVAYEDVNGNGRLDLIPSEHVGPIDRILASSGQSPEGNWVVVYTSDPNSLLSLGKGHAAGFNLVHAGRVVDTDTAIPLTLDPQPGLNASVCSGRPTYWHSYFEEASGLVENSLMTSAHCFPSPLLVYGRVGRTAYASFASIIVLREGEPVGDARVTVNGFEVPYHPNTREYHARTTDGVWMLPGGLVEALVEIPGEAPQSLTVQLPEAFALTEPAAGAKLPMGTPTRLRWSEARAELYVPYLSRVREDVEPGLGAMGSAAAPSYVTELEGVVDQKGWFFGSPVAPGEEFPVKLFSVGINLSGKPGESQLQGFLTTDSVPATVIGETL